MSSLLRTVLLSAVVLSPACARAADAPAPAETPAQRDARMAWWRDARFGLFIHWGVYSVPAGSYHGKPVGGAGEWIMHDAKIPVAEYAAFAKQFNPVKFDADAWVRTAKDAGMKYIVITSKHHDGFAMYDSDASDYNIHDATPFHRDPLAELAAACKKHGLKLGFYYSQAQDWHHTGGAAIGGHWDPAQDGDMTAYIRKVAVPQVREILTKYGPDVPAILWWDTPEGMTKERADMLLPLLALKPGIITNNRLGVYPGDTETPEQHIPATGYPGRDWETCMTMNDTWGFKAQDQHWKSVETLVRNLVDIASKGGNYLLNVGPTSEGQIPTASIERLEAVGKWMRVNGEAIYGTSASPFRKLAWGRCTQKPGTLYLSVFDWPKDGKLVVPMAGKVTRAYLLAEPSKALTVTASGEGVVIDVPSTAPDPIASVVVAKVEGDIQPIAQETVVTGGKDGVLRLGAAEAEVVGSTAKLEGGEGDGNIGYWTDASNSLKWKARVTKPGTYRISVIQACEDGTAGAEYTVKLGEKSVRGKVEATGSWHSYKTVSLGTVELPAGPVTVELKPTRKPGFAVMNLRAVVLEP